MSICKKWKWDLEALKLSASVIKTVNKSEALEFLKKDSAEKNCINCKYTDPCGGRWRGVRPDYGQTTDVVQDKGIIEEAMSRARAKTDRAVC